MKIYGFLASFAVSMAFAMPLSAQTTLTLEECRTKALENSSQSKIAREKVNAATYDKKAAFANYLPKVSATGLYLHNSEDISFLSPETQSQVSTLGNSFQNVVTDVLTSNLSDIKILSQFVSKQDIQKFVENLTPEQVREQLNRIGGELADNLSVDLDNVYVGMVSVEQPLYVGGKIRAYNKVSDYARELASVQMQGEDEKVILAVDEAYWQIVSVAAKLRLTDQYVELLEQMEHNIVALQSEGLATQSDVLSVRVRLNEAQMSQVKALNGLALSRMLLCQLCGLPLDSDISVADEGCELMYVSKDSVSYTPESIIENRTELKSLDLAVNMYNEKARIVRADFLPTVALTGNYVLTNPSVRGGVKYDFNDMWNVGLVAKLPLFHFGEGMNKYRRAKSDVLMTQYQLDDAIGKVNLQVSQYEMKIKECDSRLAMSEKNLDSASENLRVANVGFSEGVVEPSLVMAAQTAWLKANSEQVDATIERIMADVYLRQAIGMLK